MNQVTVQRRSARAAALPSTRPAPAARADAASTGAMPAENATAGHAPADAVSPWPTAVRRTTAPRLAGAGGVVALGALLTLGVLVAAALLGGAATPSELSDPGPLTRWGLLVSRTAYDLAAIGTLGVLLVSVVLLPRADGVFGPDAARLVRWVSWWAGAWAVTAVATVLLTLSKVAGIPVADVLAPDVLPLVLDLEVTRSLLSSAWLAALVAVGARMTRSPATGVLLLLTAVGALVLPAITGHARHGDLVVVTATSLALHVVAAAAWVGGLAALVVHLRRSEVALAVALPRYSTFALVCFAMVGASGLVTGWASLNGVADLWTTSYGQLLLGKIAALVLLGAFGHRHRRRTVAAAAQRRPRAFVTLASAELILMACAAALAVALSNSAPPPEEGHSTAAADTVAVAAR